MKGFLIFMVVWVAGCILFDGLLELQGGWLMSAGFYTGVAAIALSMREGE